MAGREVVRHEAAALLIYTGSMLKRTWPIPRKYTSNDLWKLKQQILKGLPKHYRLLEVFTPSGHRFLRLANPSVVLC